MITATQIVSSSNYRFEQVSSSQPFTNRGYYRTLYKLFGPVTYEEAIVACREQFKLPVEQFTVGTQNEDGSWRVSYSYDCTD